MQANGTVDAVLNQALIRHGFQLLIMTAAAVYKCLITLPDIPFPRGNGYFHLFATPSQSTAASKSDQLSVPCLYLVTAAS